ALALAALEDLLDLVVVVEREPLDLAVVLAGEERAGAFVGEELPGDAVEGADVDRGHTVDETGPDRGEERAPRPEAGRLCLAGAQQLRRHPLVHERQRPLHAGALDAAL